MSKKRGGFKHQNLVHAQVGEKLLFTLELIWEREEFVAGEVFMVAHLSLNY